MYWDGVVGGGVDGGWRCGGRVGTHRAAVGVAMMRVRVGFAT